MQTQAFHTDSDWTAEKSIVVLPFRNMSSDPENEYFSDGMTEDIINALTRVGGLKVIARTSAFSFKGKNADVREVGRQLGVSYVLEGSVRKAGNKVRVTAQLIKASNGFHVFSEVYDRVLEDIFEVQDDISQKIVRRFTDKVGAADPGMPLISSSTSNMEAYQHYLKGRFSLNQGSLEAANAAIQYFETALKKDKDFALACTGLAACYTFLGGSGLMDAGQAYNLADEYARKANLLDDGVAETHLALANCSFWPAWDFENAGHEIRRAIRLSPGTSGIHGFHALYLMASEKLEEALVEAKLAVKLDPLSLKSRFQLGEVHYRSRNFVEALELFELVLAENPYYKEAGILKAWCHLFLGNAERAREIFSRIPVTTEKSMVFYGGLAMVYSRLKQTGRILDCMRDFRKALAEGYTQWIEYNYTLIYRALGEKQLMYKSLANALRAKLAPLVFIRVDPVWDEYRSDPEFSELLDLTFLSEKNGQVLDLRSDTREVLRVNPGKILFIEARENYSRIVWLEGENRREKLLRVTMKSLESQIPGSAIIRCHRSYMINTAVRYTVLGNSNGYRLKSKHFREIIPVSRSLGKEIVSRLRNS